MLESLVYVETLDWSGGTWIMEPVTAKLLIDLYQYDFGFRKLMVYACVGKNPDLYSQSEKKLFGNLPSCKFSSSNATVTLSFASRSVSDRVAAKHEYNSPIANLVISEMQASVQNLRPQIERKKAIRGKCFCDALIDSLDFELRDRSHAKRLVNKIPHILHLLSKNPYEPVDKNAHPIARKLLVETFFWSSGDPLSPHGSDIGAMIFFDYEKDTPEFGNGTFGFYCSAVAGVGVDSDPVIVFQVLAAVVFAELKKYGKIGSRLAKESERRFEHFEKECLQLYQEPDRRTLTTRIAIMKSVIGAAVEPKGVE